MIKKWLLIISSLIVIFGSLAVFAFSSKGLELHERFIAALPIPKPDTPDGVKLLYNIAYGPHPKQVLDVYTAKQPPTNRSDIMVLVHGGWDGSDKTQIPTVDNSLSLTQSGWTIVSLNYRPITATDLVGQAEDITRAIAYVQQNAHQWHSNPQHVVLMGHSSGGMLVALATARYEQIEKFGGWKWSASVGLDATIYNVIEQRDHPISYDFFLPFTGPDLSKWEAASAAKQFKKDMPPLLAVCHLNNNCWPTREGLKFAKTSDAIFQVLPVDLDHGQISGELGKNPEYTQKVLGFARQYMRP